MCEIWNLFSLRSILAFRIEWMKPSGYAITIKKVPEEELYRIASLVEVLGLKTEVYP
ncbi:MAG TPA: hypothetical protein PKI34_11240 [Bacteroidales bacterium]|nr:hypothetical protein [Bacteroidales bacterium]